MTIHPKRKEVNLVIEPNAGNAPGKDARITFTSGEISMWEALRAIAQSADLELIAEPYALVLRNRRATSKEPAGPARR